MTELEVLKALVEKVIANGEPENPVHTYAVVRLSYLNALRISMGSAAVKLNEMVKHLPKSFIIEDTHLLLQQVAYLMTAIVISLDDQIVEQRKHLDQLGTPE